MATPMPIMPVQKDPPAPSRRGKYTSLLKALMEPENVGKWFQILTTSKATRANVIAFSLRSGRAKIPPGRWEFTSRAEDGGGTVYARYLGREGIPLGEGQAP